MTEYVKLSDVKLIINNHKSIVGDKESEFRRGYLLGLEHIERSLPYIPAVRCRDNGDDTVPQEE